MLTSARLPGHQARVFSQIRPSGGGASTVVPQVEPHCGHRYSYLSPSGRTRSRRLRTGTARLQRGQASRVASIRSNAGFRCVGIALPTITTDANNGKVGIAALSKNTEITRDRRRSPRVRSFKSGLSSKAGLSGRAEGRPEFGSPKQERRQSRLSHL